MVLVAGCWCGSWSSMMRFSGSGYSWGPEQHAVIGYLSGGRTLLTRSLGGAWLQEAAADTQASSQAKHAQLRSQGIPHRTKRSRILVTLKQNKGMYKKHIRVYTQVD